MFKTSWQKEIDSIRAGERPELAAVVELDGDKRQVVMLLHGYAGSPFDFAPLIPALRELGVDFSAQHLAGHEDPAGLPGATADAWLREVLRQYDEIAKHYHEVYVVGFSLGGLLGLHLAAERDVRKLILLSPYLAATQKWFYFGSLENWSERLKGFIPAVRKLQSGQINFKSGRGIYKSLGHMPLAPVAEIQKLAEQVRPKLSSIESETVWFHSVVDNVTDFNASQSAFAELTCPTRLFLKLERSNHIILFDHDGPPVMETIVSMIAAGMQRNKTKQAKPKRGTKAKTKKTSVKKTPKKKTANKKLATNKKKSAKKKTTTKKTIAKKKTAAKKTKK